MDSFWYSSNQKLTQKQSSFYHFWVQMKTTCIHKKVFPCFKEKKKKKRKKTYYPQYSISIDFLRISSSFWVIAPVDKIMIRKIHVSLSWIIGGKGKIYVYVYIYIYFLCALAVIEAFNIIWFLLLLFRKLQPEGSTIWSNTRLDPYPNFFNKSATRSFRSEHKIFQRSSV